MNRVISLAHLTALELTPPEVITAAASAGYSHAGLRLAPSSPGVEAQHPMIGDTPMLRETLRRMADTGVQLLDFEVLRINRDTVIRDFLPVIETGARLGGRFALVAGDVADEASMTDSFAELCELGAPLGICMGLEFMPWTGVRTLASARRIVEATNPQNGRIIIDAIHVDRAGETAADIAAMPRHLHCYFQICDLPAERPTDAATMIYQARQARLPPGEGGLDLIGMLRAIPADLPISIEIPMVELAKTMSAVERARMLKRKTEAMLAQLEESACS
jgi:sugar phosphate isomerase/epimerase